MGTDSYLKLSPQKLFPDGRQAIEVCEYLKNNGTKSILFISAESSATCPVIAGFAKAFGMAGFRLASYTKKDEKALVEDVLASYDKYKESSCDTIVVAGGFEDVCIGKLTASLASIAPKSIIRSIVRTLSGRDTLKKAIPPLVCLAMDNSDIYSSGYARCIDEDGTSLSFYSNLMIPSAVVFDPDLAVRTTGQVSTNSALCTLTGAVEAYLCDSLMTAPSYKADSFNAISLVLGNLGDVIKDPNDSYLRTRLELAGLYGGTAMRAVGPGPVRLIGLSLSDIGVEPGCLKVLFAYLEVFKDNLSERMGQLYHDLLQNEFNPEKLVPGFEREAIERGAEDDADLFLLTLELAADKFCGVSGAAKAEEIDFKKFKANLKRRFDTYGLPFPEDKDLKTFLEAL